MNVLAGAGVFGETLKPINIGGIVVMLTGLVLFAMSYKGKGKETDQGEKTLGPQLETEHPIGQKQFDEREEQEELLAQTEAESTIEGDLQEESHVHSKSTLKASLLCPFHRLKSSSTPPVP